MCLSPDRSSHTKLFGFKYFLEDLATQFVKMGLLTRNMERQVSVGDLPLNYSSRTLFTMNENTLRIKIEGQERGLPEEILLILYPKQGII